jgi:hypothetical protein
MSKLRSLAGRALALLVAGLTTMACAVGPDEDDPVDAEGEESTESTQQAAKTWSTTLYYEGSCEFLRTCSVYSRGLPQGQVSWGCTGKPAYCNDWESWVAGPSKSYCGKTVQFCNAAGKCMTAKVKDISEAGIWEGSKGLLNALDGKPVDGTCKKRGTGAADVKVTVW